MTEAAAVEAVMDLSPGAFEELREKFASNGIPVGEHEGREVIVLGTLAFRKENEDGVRCYLVYQGKVTRPSSENKEPA